METQENRALKRAIFLATYNRTDLLENCIKSIIVADGREDYIFFIIQQDNNFETTKVIEKYKSDIDHWFKINGESRTTIHNINFNRVRGYEIAFSEFSCEYAVAIEDDTQISKDALKFVNKMMEKYSMDTKFGCVNLLSLGHHGENPQAYSIYRSPLVGQGSAISSQIWRDFGRRKLLSRIETEPFDGAIEDFMKCKFSIFPNRSRILDEGWEGTHPSNARDPYFEANRLSWMGSVVTQGTYSHIQRNLNLRTDWVAYNKSADFYYSLRRQILDLNRTSVGNLVINQIRRIFNLSKL